MVQDKMVGRKVPYCFASKNNKRCRCFCAHDGKGRKMERRVAKKRDRRAWKGLR